MSIKDKALTVEVKITLKYPVNGMECIHYTKHGRDLNPKFFDSIIKCVDEDFSRTYNELSKNI
jgi:hypothetical protein